MCIVGLCHSIGRLHRVREDAKVQEVLGIDSELLVLLEQKEVRNVRARLLRDGDLGRCSQKF